LISFPDDPLTRPRSACDDGNAGGSKTLFLTPGRNNFVEKLKGSTGTHVVQSARTDGESMELMLDGSGNFQSLDLVEEVPKTSPLETFDLFCTL
jgi:hypothetical protein